MNRFQAVLNTMLSISAVALWIVVILVTSHPTQNPTQDAIGYANRAQSAAQEAESIKSSMSNYKRDHEKIVDLFRTIPEKLVEVLNEHPSQNIHVGPIYCSDASPIDLPSQSICVGCEAGITFIGGNNIALTGGSFSFTDTNYAIGMKDSGRILDEPSD